MKDADARLPEIGPDSNTTPLMPLDAATATLARRHAPLLRLDAAEPFRPDAAGITLLAPGQRSPSCRHTPCAPEGTAQVIEYALWWDGDIQHLYELEHVWISLDATGRPLACAASAHGALREMDCAWQDHRPVLFCEPGKHAHAGDPAPILDRRAALTRTCTSAEDLTGIAIPDMLAAELSFLSAYDQFLGREYLASLRFTPTFDFTVTADTSDLLYLSWPELRAEIPRDLRARLETLRRRRRGLKAVFLDSGNTLIDEPSQIWDADRTDIVLSADPIPGGDTLVAALRARGLPVALVADGREESFVNVHGAMGFWNMFDSKAISENVGAAKPHPRMFTEAMRKLGLRPEDGPGIVMLGNNMKRDIRGANALGLTSVWLDRNDRYDRVPEGEQDMADHTIPDLDSFLALIETLQQASGWNNE